MNIFHFSQKPFRLNRWPSLLAVVGGLAVLFPPEAFSQDIFRLYTTSNHQRCEVSVNGFPLREFDITNTLTLSTILDPFLVKGTNTLVVRTLDDNTVTNAGAAVILRLDYGQGRPDQRTNLFMLNRTPSIRNGITREAIEFDGGAWRFEWRTVLDGSRSSSLVDYGARKFTSQYVTNADSRIEISIILDAPRLLTLPWMGPVAPLTAGDRAEIAALVESIHTELKDKDADSLLALLSKKTERSASAFGTPLAEQETPIREFYANWFASAAFSIADTDFAALQFKNYPAANVVQVLSNGNYPIQGTGEGFTFKMPIYVSKISGTWRLVE